MCSLVYNSSSLRYFAGDVVFRGPNQATITILDNDEAYGVFQFMDSESKTVQEGDTARFL